MKREADYFAYDGAHGEQVSFPLGGIGAGSIGFSASGRLIDWEIANRPDKGSTNGFSHFALRVESPDGECRARVLQGPFHGNLAGDRGAGSYREFGYGVRREYLTGLPHFRQARFSGFFPCAELGLADPDFPATVKVSAFSPFIPMDDRTSSLPVALFAFEVANPGPQPLRCSLVGCLGNPVKGPHGARLVRTDGASGMLNFGHGIDPADRDFGEVILATDEADISYQHEWYRGSWFDSLEVYWRDINAAGPLRDRRYDGQHFDRRLDGGKRHRGHSVLAAHRTVAPGEKTVFRFAIAWYFPHFVRDWLNLYGYAVEPTQADTTWKNYYATQWSGAEEIAGHALRHWDSLRDRTFAFRDTLRRSTLPLPVLDAVSANLGTLRTPTVLRLPDGTLYGWEGCDSTAGSCEGSCSHVWNYQQVTPFLFPALERGMRIVDFEHNQDPQTGGMSFRLSAPLGHGRYDIRPCADGQFGNVMKAYRDWKASGDEGFLRRVWPNVRKAIAFAWHPLNHDRWDPDKTGVLHGRQHHTLDMELFGPNGWLTGFYLGALRAGAEMARRVGEETFASELDALFEKGRRWTDEHLFNGSYYVHDVDVTDAGILASYEGGPESAVLKGSIHDLYWSGEHGQIKYQIVDGCLLDQLLGEWHARLYGIGPVFDPDKVATTLQSIYRLNFKKRLGDVVNPCRVFGLEEESGSIVCEWPKGAARPVFPIPYSQETFHGSEYAFGSLLMLAGEVAKGTEIFAAVRDRYRGGNRNPWNEMECGSNYVRSMAAYGGLLALSGFGFDLTRHRIAFDPKVRAGDMFRSFWAVGEAWGEVTIRDGSILLAVSEGRIDLARIGLPTPRGALRGEDPDAMRDSTRGAIQGQIQASIRGTLDHVPFAARIEDGDAVFERMTVEAGSVVELQAERIRIGELPEVMAI